MSIIPKVIFGSAFFMAGLLAVALVALTVLLGDDDDFRCEYDERETR